MMSEQNGTKAPSRTRQIWIRVVFAEKLRQLAALRCQDGVQTLKLILNAPDAVLLRRQQHGFDAYNETMLFSQFGLTRVRIDSESLHRVKRLAELQGYTHSAFISMVLSAPEDTLLAYAEEGINMNIERYNQKIRNKLF